MGLGQCLPLFSCTRPPNPPPPPAVYYVQNFELLIPNSGLVSILKYKYSCLQPVPSNFILVNKSSLFLNIRPYSFLFLLIPSYSSLVFLIPLYSSLFLFIPLCSSLFLYILLNSFHSYSFNPHSSSLLVCPCSLSVPQFSIFSSLLLLFPPLIFKVTLLIPRLRYSSIFLIP